MSEINALEELRTLSMVRMDGWLRMDTQKIADNIEAEIVERFMELPVDADGVPIKPGDIMQFRNDAPVRVDSIGNSKCYVGDFGWFGGNGGFYGKGTLKCCRHVKPRTIEDVMAEYEELAANQNVKDYFEVSKELRTIQSEQFRDEPELELYKEVNGCRFYIELPYDELWIMTDKVEVKHHSYSYRYERPNGNTVMSCSSLCGYPREWAIERLDEAIEEIRELLVVGE